MKREVKCVQNINKDIIKPKRRRSKIIDQQ